MVLFWENIVQNFYSIAPNGVLLKIIMLKMNFERDFECGIRKAYVLLGGALYIMFENHVRS